MVLSVEVSEVVEHTQWLTQEESRNLTVDRLAQVREEIGDVMIYLTELADKLVQLKLSFVSRFGAKECQPRRLCDCMMPPLMT
jgi:NTP pyrophosphatase (non-canonical NTP hydrolase)